MWNQPYFNTPPNPMGGYILVPVGGPNSPTTPSVPSVPVKSKSISKALKQALRDREAIDGYIKTLEDKKKADKKPDEKKDEKKLSAIHLSMLMMLSAPILGLCEFKLLQILASSLLTIR